MRSWILPAWALKPMPRSGSVSGSGVTPEMNSPAAFMATNAAHALAAYDTLRRRGLVPDLDEAALRTVFEQIELSTCCEVMPGTPAVLLDGAHNASAAASLASVLRSTFEGRRSVQVISIDPKKEYEKMIPDSRRTMAIADLCRCRGSGRPRCCLFPSRRRSRFSRPSRCSGFYPACRLLLAPRQSECRQPGRPRVNIRIRIAITRARRTRPARVFPHAKGC